MNKLIKTKLSKFIYPIIMFLLQVNVVFAQSNSSSPNQLSNPLGKKVNSLEALFANIINYLLGFVGMVALVYFIIGGFYWLTAAGNQERIKKGKDTLVWALLGLVAVLGSYVILNQFITAIAGPKSN